ARHQRRETDRDGRGQRRRFADLDRAAQEGALTMKRTILVGTLCLAACDAGTPAATDLVAMAADDMAATVAGDAAATVDLAAAPDDLAMTIDLALLPRDLADVDECSHGGCQRDF